MSERQVVILVGDTQRRTAHAYIDAAPKDYRMTIEPPRRSLDANAKMWVVLTEIARQVLWHGQRLEPSEWKDMATAALKQQKVVPGISGGFVVLGSSTSRMSKAELAELIEFLMCFGAENGVAFNEPQPV